MKHRPGGDGQKRQERVTAYRPSLDERAALIEACCISYFRPHRYNTDYMDFPGHQFRMLDPIYAADFAQLVVELDNMNIGGQRIYSARVKPAAVHCILVDFRRLEGKHSPFPILGTDSRA